MKSFFQKRRSLIGYCGLLSAVSLLYLWIRSYGNTLVAPGPGGAAGAGRAFSPIHVNDFVHVMVALALVIACARTLGAVFRLIHQPPVVGEMIAGIMLGPSLLGHLAPTFAAYMLPQSIAPLLNVLSQVGIILYMFLVGLELDLSTLRDRAHATITISHASILAPFLLGALLALLLYPELSNSTVSFTAFSLFLGVSMSVTAFPVLARILTDRRIHKTKMGVLTLACAAIDDVTAWCLLAFVVSVTQSRAGHALPTLLLATSYIAAMLLLAQPLVIRLTSWIDGKGRLTQTVLAFVLLAILLSSLATETIGIHSVFGAFILGAIIPHGSALARDLAGKLEDFVVVFLLPAFFAFTGLRTQIGLVNGSREWFFCLLIVVIASLGKFGGSAIAAKLSGLSWRDASAIGVLMNTRGLMELIVLNIGLELHVISPTLFAMLVIMALATTFATTPILHFIMPRRRFQEETAAIDASRQRAAASERTGTLIQLSNPNAIAPLLDIALSLTSSDAPPPRVLALNRSSSTGAGPRLGESAPSRSPVLAAALDAAWSRGTVIIPEAIWTSDAATEIAIAAEKSRVRWLLLESGPSLFGRHAKRGVAIRTLEKLSGLPVHVAIVLQSSGSLGKPLTCVVEGISDGEAVIELATQIANKSQLKIYGVVAIPAVEKHWDQTARSPAWLKGIPHGSAIEWISIAGALNGARSIPLGTVVVGRDVAEGGHFPIEDLTARQAVIVVQGAGKHEPLDASELFPVAAIPAPSAT